MNMFILPTVISQSNLEDLIESQIGNMLADKKVKENHIKWYKKGDEPVTVKRVDQNTIKVDVDLGRKKNKVTYEVDVDFKIDFKIKNNNIKIVARDISVKFDFPWFMKIFAPLTSQVIKAIINKKLSDKFGDTKMILYKASLVYIPEIEVKGDGDIEINWRIPLLLRSH